MSRPTKAVIDLQALRHNYQLAESLAPESKTIPMVKANAYGHGAVKVAQALADLAPAFGVACIEEALELRSAGIEQPILLLEGAFEAAELKLAATKGFWVMVENHQQKEAIINADLALPLTVWLGVDSGMHRLGFQPEDISQVYQTLNGSRNVSQPIVFTSHFACADDLDSEATAKQIDTFKACAPAAALQSLANSAAILAWPKAQREWQRPGYMLYGNSPFSAPQKNADQLKPVMAFESAVISLRTIAAGESVGYTANAINGTPVLINGVRCPLVGRVSMDMITVDVTELTEVAIGDKAVLWGPDLPVNEVAGYCDSIGYELLTRMPGRVPRVYL